MDAESVLFPRVFRGYERKSVNDYILKTNRDFSEETEELKRQIETLSDSIDNKTRIINDQKEELFALRSEIDLKKKNEDELRERISSIESSYALKLSDVQQERDELLQKVNEIEAQIAFIKSERDQMVIEKKMEEDAKIKKFDEELSAYREEISAELRVLTKKVLKEILSGVDSMRNDLSELSSVSENKANVMLGAIDDYEEEMKQEIRRIINDFNT